MFPAGGGVIVLGAAEGPDGVPLPSGLANPSALVRDLWNALNNTQKVSANLLLDSDVTVESVGASPIVVVRVPRADRMLRPVYINNNPNTGTYRRNGEGDYRCSPDVVRSLVRDSAEGAADRLTLPGFGLDALCRETVQSYRNALRAERPQHPWAGLDDAGLLLRLGAVGRSTEDGELHPTRAGLLMFGYAWRITEEFPQYFLDCRQVFTERRWDNRVTSASGDWSGNVFDFWYKAYSLLSEGLPVPFELDAGMTRIDDTPQHKAVREALTNMLVHADYYGRTGLVALRTNEGIELSNPGVLRLPVGVIEGGGVSDPRNPTLLTMFNLVGKGDKAGSGFDVLRQAARYAGVADPVLAESYDPDRVTLSVSLAMGGLSLKGDGRKGAAAKTGEDRRRPANGPAKTGERTGEDRRRPAKTGEDRRRFRACGESARHGDGVRGGARRGDRGRAVRRAGPRGVPDARDTLRHGCGREACPHGQNVCDPLPPSRGVTVPRRLDAPPLRSRTGTDCEAAGIAVARGAFLLPYWLRVATPSPSS